MKRRQIAWILILIVNLAYVAWGAAAAALPDQLLGPGGKAILPAGYEGYSGGSWSQLVRASPLNAGYMTVLWLRCLHIPILEPLLQLSVRSDLVWRESIPRRGHACGKLGITVQ